MMTMRKSSAWHKAAVCVVLAAWTVSACGCEALVRKFTRKHKNGGPQEELVIQPQEYPVTATTEELYRKYFMYASAWLGEAHESLVPDGNQKKRLASLDASIKELVQCRGFLNDELQKKLDGYLAKVQAIRAKVEADTYARETNMRRSELEQVRRLILRDFSWSKVKRSLREAAS